MTWQWPGSTTGSCWPAAASTSSALAHTGQQGLDLAAELRPELVLLDIHLPDMSGLDVLQQLRGRQQPLDVLVITASRELDTVRGAMAGGVLHYLVKPFTSQALNERLDEYLLLRRELAAGGAAGPLDQDSIDRLVAPTRRASAADPVAGPAASCRRQPGGEVAEGPVTADAGRRHRGAQVQPRRTSRRPGWPFSSDCRRVSARRYLEYLVIHGFARLTPRYGAAGRPENRYLWKR